MNNSKICKYSVTFFTDNVDKVIILKYNLWKKYTEGDSRDLFKNTKANDYISKNVNTEPPRFYIICLKI